MGEAPLVTPEELRREAWHCEEDLPGLASYLRRAARSIEFWRTAATEIAHQEQP